MRVFETVKLYSSFLPDVEYPFFLRAGLCTVQEYRQMLCGTCCATVAAHCWIASIFMLHKGCCRIMFAMFYAKCILKYLQYRRSDGN